MRNKFNFTPGPWKVEEYEDKTLNIETDYKNGLNEVLICGGLYKTGGFSSGKCSNEANAKLIAAAPEMIEALITAYKHMMQASKDAGGCSFECNSNHCDDCIHAESEEKIRAAIEKATGLTWEEIKNV